MQRTIMELLEQRLKEREQTTWTATVKGVDYVAHRIAVNIRGKSGPSSVHVPPSIDLGTATSPKVVADSTRVLIQRMDDDTYICLAIL